MRICNKCNSINEDGAMFCNKCGAPLGTSYDAGQQEESLNTQPQHPSVNIGFSDAVRICLKEKYASIDGRATRSEYWFYVLFTIIITFTVGLIGVLLGIFLSSDNFIGALIGFYVLNAISVLVLFCPSICVLVRRLHDTGRSGWWYWIWLIPYIGTIVLIVLLCLDSQEHDNKYGPYIG